MTKLINDGFKKSLRQQLRRTMTKSEAVLWKHIKGNQLGYKFRRQVSIGNYVVDFYCPKLKLIIEVDGLTHNEEEVFEKDIKRDKNLNNLGFIIKRYSSERIFFNLNEVLVDIYEICQTNQANTPS